METGQLRYVHGGEHDLPWSYHTQYVATLRQEQPDYLQKQMAMGLRSSDTIFYSAWKAHTRVSQSNTALKDQ